MQRFLIIYTTLAALLAAPGAVWATDRYGHAHDATGILTQGEWWKSDGILTPDETKERIGEFVMVKGRVLGVFETRNDRYLNFGEDYKTDFTVRIPKKLWKQFGELKEKAITVRGVLREYNGPLIVVDVKEQLHAD